MTRGKVKIFRACLLFGLTVLAVNGVVADCKTDRFGDVYCGKGKCETDKEGKVYCSRYQFGDAVIDKYGNVICGKGRCLPSSDFNDYFCSRTDGGGAGVDHLGAVKCYGGCEKASPAMCESEKGG